LTAQPTARVRVRQFFAALAARRHPPDESPAWQVLTADQLALFRRMSPEDRSHGLEVLRLLRTDGNLDPILLQAGLLHDVGKADSGVGLPHRILRVLLARRARPLWHELSRSRVGFRESFWVLANHPEIGADRLAASGAERELVELVRYHESESPAAWSGTPQSARHAALASADARC
jgi:hypothetical protein